LEIHANMRNKMDFIEDYQFRNSDSWLKYSHERYLPLEDIRHRLGVQGEEWEKLRSTFQQVRKSQAIVFQFKSLNKVFWYFEADCIRKKLSDIEKLGIQLYDKIHSSRTFESEFIVNAAVEEAITSAIYEGANSTRAKARQLIAEGRTPADKDEYMIFNNYEAMRWIKKTSASQITLDMILQLHTIVTRNTMSGNDVHYSGKFRDDRVFIGPHEGIEHNLIEPALQEALDQTTNNRRFIHPLLRGILLHYFVAYIHPFFDGNGRTARGLFYYKAIRNELNFVELLSISAHLKEHGKRYERAYENAVEHQLDMTYFVDFALDSLLYALKKVDQKVKFLINIQVLKRHFGLNDNNIALLQRMSLHKFRHVTIEEYAKDIDRSHELARLDLKKLTELNLLLEKKIGKKLAYLVNSDLLKKTVAALTIPPAQG
jgi:Fic family protein